MKIRYDRALSAIVIGIFLFSGSVFGESKKEPYGLVSLRITVQEFDYAAPWNKKPEHTVIGNGLVIDKNQLLTTAGLVKNATLIQVRKFGRYPDYKAKAVLVDYEVNLALLEVDDPEFWEGLKPLPISSQPVDSGRFDINRWRFNGRFEQGTGEVVELRVSTSRFGNLEYPELRGNTTMKGLGWSEVLTSKGKVIGMISGYNVNGLLAVNSPLIKLFIQAAQKKPYRGFAHRGFSWQRLNHFDLKKAYGLKKDSPGILVREILAGGTGSEDLQEGDILLKIGDHQIDPEGQINHPLYGPILFTIAINETLEESLSASIIRQGEKMEISLKRSLFSEEDYRIHPYSFDKQIDYEMFGGLVIQELSMGYLKLWGKGWKQKAPTRLVIEYYLNRVRERGKPPAKVLVIGKLLPDSSNLGYEDVENAMLIKVNGKSMTSLEDFRNSIKNPLNGFHILEILPGQGRGKMIFSDAEIEEANQRVQERYGLK